MDARLVRAAWGTAVLCVSLGASYRTANFVVTAPTPDVAQVVGEAAERYRRELAIEWLGHVLPNWSRPCPIEVRVGPELGAGGATSFVFDRGEVFGWQMTIQGSPQRVLDSVLPHEVTHTIFASHFRRPLPRWADEGACSTVEHPSERLKQQKLLITFLKTGRGIAFQRMFAMAEYPPDVLPLYAQGHSLATFFIQQGGRRKFVSFLADGMRDGRWSAAIQKHYGYRDLSALQDAWLQWVRSGSPTLSPQQNSVADQQNSLTDQQNSVADQQNSVPAPQSSVAAGGQAELESKVGDPAGEGRLVPVVRGRSSPATASRLGSARELAGSPVPSASSRRLGEWRPAGLATGSRLLPGTQDAPTEFASAPAEGSTVRSAVNRPPAVQKLRQMIVQWDSRLPAHAGRSATEDESTHPTPSVPESEAQQAEGPAAASGDQAGWQPVSTTGRPRGRGTDWPAQAVDPPDDASADGPADMTQGPALSEDEADWGPSVYDVRARGVVRR